MSDTQNPALDLSNALAAAVDKAGASVVQVSARQGIGSSGVIWSADGVLVAADHNVERDEGITVGLSDGSTVPATLVGRDPGTDLAVLRVEATGLAAPDWSDLAGLRVGNLVLGLLRPGQSIRATLGIVSALSDLGNEPWRTHSGGRIDRYLQTDLDILKGFSGGLLVDAAGRALGLNNAGLWRKHAIAIPHATLARVVGSLLEHGRIRRGYLGIGLAPVRLPGPLAEATGQAVGLLVMGVQPGSTAEQGGLLLGDILVSLDGEGVADLGQLQAVLGEDRIGTEVTAKIVRGGEVRELRLMVGAK
ncbi:MAG: S1C family serine protease [Thermoanaerobaculia bacterium]